MTTASRDASADPAPVPNKLLFLVEDNPDDEALTLRAFSRHGIRHVKVARDGVEALDYLLGRGPYLNGDLPERPAVVLLDLKLPRLDGMEVLRSLRADARTKHLPVVILTSSREDQDLTEGYDSGANSYVRKPVDFAAFVAAIRQLGVYWLLLNEEPPR